MAETLKTPSETRDVCFPIAVTPVFRVTGLLRIRIETLGRKAEGRKHSKSVLFHVLSCWVDPSGALQAAFWKHWDQTRCAPSARLRLLLSLLRLKHWLHFPGVTCSYVPLAGPGFLLSQGLVVHLALMFWLLQEGSL